MTSTTAIREDLKQLILDELISFGADKNRGVIPKGVKSAVADRCKVDKNNVTRVWSNVLHHGTASRNKRGDTTETFRRTSMLC